VLDRGPDYGSWRREKDERAVANSGLSVYDLPSFAAIRTQDREKNLYGDFHFLLKQNVRDRAAYTYGTGTERRDLKLVIADAIDKGVPKGMMENLTQGRLSGTEFEIHIYGPLDFERDVAQIFFPNQIEISQTDQTKLMTPQDSIEEFKRKLAVAVDQKTNAARNLLDFAREKGIPCSGGAYDQLNRPVVKAPQAQTAVPVKAAEVVKEQRGGLMSFLKGLGRKTK
jgi:hypothetical protein